MAPRTACELLNIHFIFASTELMLICLPINLLGIYFIVFVMKEPKFDPETQNNMTQIGTGNTSSSPLDEANNQCCLPIYSVIETIFRRRKDRGRAILIFLLFLYFISLGPIFGEPQNEYNFTRLRFNWGSVAYAHYSTFISALELISTTIMITVFKKWLKLADASIGLVSSALSFVTKILIVNIFHLCEPMLIIHEKSIGFSFTQRQRSCFTSSNPLIFSMV